MNTQMYNHLIGLPLNSFGKQVKQVMKEYPYELGDCLIVAQIDYCTEWGVSYRVYRLEVYIETNKIYLDIITDTQSNFLSLGGNHSQIDFPPYTSKQICDSLAIQQHMKEAF